MNASCAHTQTDFDRIARLSNDEWDHNSHYHRFLLRQLPAYGAEALEIGCGTGMFTRLLAERFRRVRAIDVSSEMLRIAAARSRQYVNIDYQLADVLAYQFFPEQFDCIASIAVFHHLPFQPMLATLKNALKPDGVLIVLDLFEPEGIIDTLASVAAVPVNLMLRVIHRLPVRESPEIRAVWAEHGRTDTYLTLSHIRRICAAILPNAQVRRHLLWRYSLVWKKGIS